MRNTSCAIEFKRTFERQQIRQQCEKPNGKKKRKKNEAERWSAATICHTRLRVAQSLSERILFFIVMNYFRFIFAIGTTRDLCYKQSSLCIRFNQKQIARANGMFLLLFSFVLCIFIISSNFSSERTIFIYIYK